MKSKFYEYLKQIRTNRNYTQVQMAEKLGISRSTYSNYEAGKRSPDLETLEAISTVLNCSMDELFGRTRTAADMLDVIREGTGSYYVHRDRIVSERANPSAKGRKLGIGIQEFRKLREWNSYFVDKTRMIEEFLKSNVEVTLITRPRRFGKSLNMSMIAEFLDCTKESVDIFAGTDIYATDCMTECNQNPVILLSFLNAKGEDAKALLRMVYDVVLSEYSRYRSVLASDKIPGDVKKRAQEVYDALQLDQNVFAGKELVAKSIVILCEVLKEYYEKEVYLFIDEYDTPFISANVGGYYDEVRSFLAVLFSSALKGNSFLKKALLTGIQRVAKENIFSGLNNISVCTVGDSEYAEYFGFTEAETRGLLEYYGLKLTAEVKAMYDGYRFGEFDMYNPWSVTYYASRKRLQSYWVNTGENSMIEQAMDDCGEAFQKDYNALLEHGSVSVNVELENSFYEHPGKAALWGMLINAGMITVEDIIEENYYSVRIPNHEVATAFQRLTAHSLQVEHDNMMDLMRCLQYGKMEAFEDEYKRIVRVLPSYHDLKDENSYHMMMLGMCTYLHGSYEVKSNRESGAGRSDIILKPLKKKLPGIVMEFKYTKDEGQDLRQLAQDALKQIEDKAYDAEMSGTIYHIGLAHCGKRTEVVTVHTQT